VTAVKIALFDMNSGPCSRPNGMREVALRAEELGYESLWVGEHVVLPRPRTEHSPMEPGDPILDPIVALTFLAAETEKVRLGTGIIILPQRNPLVLAKELASLDVLSNGRLHFGIGAGYLEPELRALGVPMSERGLRTDEYLAAMQTLWYAEAPSYSGRTLAFSGVDAHPRPVQQPIPIVVGGHTSAAHRRAVLSAHGWYGFALTVEQSAFHVGELTRMASELGRPAELSDIEISVTPRGRLDAAEVARFAEAGVHRLVLRQPRHSDLAGMVEFVAEHQPARLGAGRDASAPGRVS
jgi:probable F420-dependent oxidoreductase